MPNDYQLLNRMWAQKKNEIVGQKEFPYNFNAIFGVADRLWLS